MALIRMHSTMHLVHPNYCHVTTMCVCVCTINIKYMQFNWIQWKLMHRQFRVHLRMLHHPTKRVRFGSFIILTYICKKCDQICNCHHYYS